MSRTTLPLLAVFAVVVCGGCSSPSLPSDQALAFLSPADGAQLQRADDGDPALDGVQRQVRVYAQNVVDGELITLTVTFDGQPVGDAQTAPLTSKVATFDVVTLPFGVVTVTATYAQTSKSIVVNVTDEGPLCAFVQPVDGQVFTSADSKNPNPSDYHFQTDVVVQCNGLPAGTVIGLALEHRLPTEMTIGADGRGTATGFALAPGGNRIEVRSELLAAPPHVDVILDTGCTATIAPDDGTVYLYDPALDGAGTIAPVRNVTITSSCAVGETVTVTTTGFVLASDEASCSLLSTHTITATLAAGVDAQHATAVLPVTLFQGANQIDAAVGSNANLPLGYALTNHFDVDTQPPSILFTFPDNGLDLAVADEDPALAGLQVTVRGQVSGVEAGQHVTLRVTENNGGFSDYEAPVTLTSSACFDQLTSVGEFSILITLTQDGSAAFAFTVEDIAGNSAAKDVDILVSTQVPTLAITSPVYAAAPSEVIPFLTGDALVDGGADVDPGTPGLQVDFVIAVTGADVIGRSGTLTVPGQSPTFFTFTATPQTVRVTLSDGPSGSNFVITGVVAQVQMLNGATFTSPPIKLRVDATGPSLVVVSPHDGDVVATGTTETSFVLNVGAGDEAGRPVRVRRTAPSGATLSTTTGAGAATVTITNASLALGLNTFVVEAADRASAPANTSRQTIRVFRATGSASVKFTQINGNTIGAAQTTLTLATDADNDLNDGFDLSSRVQIDAAPGLAKLTFTAVIDGALTYAGTQYVTVPPTSTIVVNPFDFTLPVGAADVTLDVVDAAAQLGSSTPLHIEAGSAAPALVYITAPVYGARLSTGSIDVTVSSPTPIALTACELFLDAELQATPPGTPRASGFSVPASSTTTVTLGLGSGDADGMHTLWVRCLNGATPVVTQRQVFDLRRNSSATLAFRDAVGVHLATSSPRFYVNGLASNSATDGTFRHDIVLDTNLPTGTTVTLDVTVPTALVEHLSSTVSGGVVTFRDVRVALSGTPAGVDTEIVATALDPYTSTNVVADRSGANAVRVDVIPPVVTSVDGCPSSIGVYNAYDDSNTANSIEWRFTYQVTGGSGSLTTSITTPTGVQTETDAVTGDPATVNVDTAFAVPTPKAAYAVSYVASALDDVDNAAIGPTCATTVNPIAPNIALSTVAPDRPFSDTGDPLPTTVLNLTDDDNASLPGLQVGFLVNAVNVSQGSVVQLCSTAPGLTGTNCTQAPGKVIAAATRGSQSAVFLLGITLVDGSYGLAAELTDPATNGTVATPVQSGTRSFPVLVDSVAPPAPTSLTWANNQTSNDSASLVRLGANVYTGASSLGAEGTIVAGASRPQDRLTTSVDVAFASPLPAGASVRLQSAQQASLDVTQVLVAPSAVVTLAAASLQQGLHDLTFTVRSPNGNLTTLQADLLIDLVAPTLAVAGPAVSPLTCGSINGCTAPGGVAAAPVGVTVADDRDLSNGCVCASTANGPCLGAGGACVPSGSTVAFGSGATASLSLALNLPEGTNLIAAQVTDGTGNVTAIVDAARVRYDVDTLVVTTGPALDVQETGGGNCASAGAACTIARDNLDPAYWYSSSTYQVNATGAGAGACAITGDTCTLQGRLVARRSTTEAFREVFHSNTGVRTGGSLDLTSAFIEALTGVGAPGLERGINWEVALEVSDSHGNVQRSPSQFVTLAGFAGALVTLERGCDHQGVGSACNGPAQGAAVVNPTQFGLRHRTQTTPYRTDLQVALDWSAPPAAAGACVDLYRDSVLVATVNTATTNVSEIVTFDDVTLTTGPQTLEVRVSDAPIVPGLCTGAEALEGVQTVSGVSATETAPDIVFAQTWRTSVGVGGDARLPGSVFLGSNANDGNAGSSGYQFATPVQATVSFVGDAANGTAGTVRLLNDQLTPLSGSLSLYSSCTTAGCTETFSASVTVPNLPTLGGDVVEQQLVAEACNPAGDCKQTTVGAVGVAEALHVKADTIAPAASSQIVCVGSSYAPLTFVGPASQYTDDASCAAACVGLQCDRAAGNVVVSIASAAGNDGAAGGPVADYDVLVAIRETATPSDDDCVSFLNGLTAPQRAASVWTDVQKTVQAAGQPQLIQLRHLPVHQRLCIAALGRDLAGNTALVDNTDAHVRVVPFLPVKAAASAYAAFDRQASERPDDEQQPSLFDFIGGYPGAMITVGDMDGDGADEIAVGDASTPGFALEGSVYIFSSRRTRAGNFTPRRVIDGPAGRAGYFGFSLAAGDFNGDGNADIAIGAPYLASNQPGNPVSGSVWVYYGRYGSTIQPLGGDTDPDVIQTSGCALTIRPTIGGSPACPAVLFESATAADSAAGLGAALAAGVLNGQGAAGARDLAIGAPGHVANRGAVYLAKNSGTLFPSQPAPNTTPVTTLVVDPATLPLSVTRLKAPCDIAATSDFAGTSLEVADLDGDGNDDVITNFVDSGAACAGAATRGYFAARGGPGALFAASGVNGLDVTYLSGSITATCLTGSGLGAQMNAVGAPDGGAAEWLACKQGGTGLLFLKGANNFFASPGVCVASGPAQVVNVDPDFQPRSAFGPQSSTACGTGASCVALQNPMFGAYGVAPYRDVNGDGRTDILLSESGNLVQPSRLLVAGYVAGTPDRMVLFTELTGNVASGAGLGTVIANIGTHAGPANEFATLGIKSDFSGTLLWIFE